MSPLPTEVIDLRDKMARWGLRGFWLLGGVAAVVMVGGFVFPKQFDIFLDVSVGIWIAAMLCVAMMVVRLIQYLLARRRFYHELRHAYGNAVASDVRRAENPPWWNHMSRRQKTLYLLGALALALRLAGRSVGKRRGRRETLRGLACRSADRLGHRPVARVSC